MDPRSPKNAGLKPDARKAMGNQGKSRSLLPLLH
jgi:hypothetical protein